MRIAILCWVVGIRVAAIQRHFRGDIFQDAGTGMIIKHNTVWK